MFYDAIEALGLLHGRATASGSLRCGPPLRDGGAGPRLRAALADEDDGVMIIIIMKIVIMIIITKIIMKSVCCRAAPARRPRR